MNEHMFIDIKSFHVQIHNFIFLGTKVFFLQMLMLKDFYAATLINNIEVVVK